MHEWPADLDVSKIFVNRELETITFALYSVYLKFNDNLTLSILFDYTYSLNSTTEEIEFPIKCTRLISSIGSKVIKAELTDKKDLCLWFEDGAKLVVNGSVDPYECYSVRFGDTEFYV